MQLSGAPTKVTVPFANSGTKNTIPTASQIGVTPGAASYTDGFPPLTFTPLASGGVPPAGADFNGILNAITQAVRWQMAGGMFAYDSSFSTAVGGYPRGAVLINAAATALWLNQSDNNTTNPDSGGSNWVGLSNGRLVAIRVFTTPGANSYTPSAGVVNVLVEVQGGGGGGGGVPASAASTISVASGGISGALTRWFGAASAQTVTIGTAGIGGTAGLTTGSAGGTSSFGSICSAPGGPGGSGAGPTSPPVNTGNGGTLPQGTGGNVLNTFGRYGQIAFVTSTGVGYSGSGGDCNFGSGGPCRNTTGTGTQALGFGAGGGGALALASGAAQAGGNGSTGIVYVYEYS